MILSEIFIIILKEIIDPIYISAKSIINII